MKTLNDYIKIYEECAIKHGEGTEEGDYKLANKSHDKLMKAFEKIIEYGDIGRDAILELLQHQDVCVRCWAATHTLKYNETLALKTLKEISRGKGLIYSGAKIVIEEWKKGNLNIP